MICTAWDALNIESGDFMSNKSDNALYLVQDDRSQLYLTPLTAEEEKEAEMLYNSDKYKAIRKKFGVK